MDSASPLICLQRGGMSARVALAGGELRGWCEHGRELLWDADARWWARSSPVLFPIVGRLRGGQTSIDGRRYAMGVHGFAAAQRFELREVQADQVALGLVSSDATRAQYPFEFDLKLNYRLHDDGLEIALCLRNTGHRSMPFAIGLHPGLRWPFTASSGAGHSIVFERSESPRVPVITSDGLFSAGRRSVVMPHRRLSLEPSLFDDDALCFLDANSRSLRFEAPDGAAIVVSSQNFPHWALWSRPGAPFLCVEAWTGHGDPEGFDGDFAAKPSMRLLAPGATSNHGMRLQFQPAQAMQPVPATQAAHEVAGP